MSSTSYPLETNGGTVTSWLAMTAPLPTMPAECSEAIYSAGGMAIAFAPVFSTSISPIDCLPTEATAYYSQAISPAAEGLPIVTSLGPFICPSGYTTGTTSALNSLSTFVGCCPSDYAFSTTIGPRSIGQCLSPLSQGQELTYYLLQHPSVTLSSWLYTSTNITATATSAWAIQVNGWVFADAIQTGSNTVSVTSAPTGTTMNSPNPTSSITQTASPSHLSSGAIAGIAVGAILIVIIALVGVACFIFRHRRKNKGPPPPFKHQTIYHEVAAPDMPAHELPAGMMAQELEAPYNYKSMREYKTVPVRS